MLRSPRSRIPLKCTDGGEGESVLGDILVVPHHRLLQPLTPQDLRGKVWCPHLETTGRFLLQFIWQMCVSYLIYFFHICEQWVEIRDLNGVQVRSENIANADSLTDWLTHRGRFYMWPLFLGSRGPLVVPSVPVPGKGVDESVYCLAPIVCWFAAAWEQVEAGLPGWNQYHCIALGQFDTYDSALFSFCSSATMDIRYLFLTYGFTFCLGLFPTHTLSGQINVQLQHPSNIKD